MLNDIQKENSENLQKILNKRIEAKRISKIDKFLLAGFSGALSSTLGMAMHGGAPEVAVGGMALTSAGILAAMIKSKIDGDNKAKQARFGDYIEDMKYFKIAPQEYAKKNQLSLAQKKEFFRGVLPEQDIKKRLSQTFKELSEEVKIWGQMADEHYKNKEEARASFEARSKKSRLGR